MNKALILLVTLTCITQAEMKKTYEVTYNCTRKYIIMYHRFNKVERLCVDNVVYNRLYNSEGYHDAFKSYNYRTKEPYYCTETIKVNKRFVNDTCTYTMRIFENVKDIKWTR